MMIDGFDNAGTVYFFQIGRLLGFSCIYEQIHFPGSKSGPPSKRRTWDITLFAAHLLPLYISPLLHLYFVIGLSLRICDL